MSPLFIDALYLVSTALILAGVWIFLRPDGADRGALFVGGGLVLAVASTFGADEIVSPGTALVGLALGAALGAFLARGVTADNAPGRLALLITMASFAIALVSPIRMHEVGAVFDARKLALDEEWKDLPDDVRRANTKEKAVRIPLRLTMPAILSAFLGGVAASAALISFLKLSRSPLRKSLPKLDEPRLPQIGALVVALFLGMLFTSWPLMETFLWLELLTGLALGYLLTIHLKIADVPPVLAAALAASGVALAAAGMAVGNIVMVIAGAIVAGGGAVTADALCRSMNISLQGVLFGQESSRTSSREEEAPRAEPVPPRVPTSTADPDTPIL